MPRTPHEQARYTRKVLESLVWGAFIGEEGTEVDAEALDWNRLRSHMERTGNLEVEGVALVLDLERALVALAARHPEAASAVVTLMMLQLDRAELNEVYGERKNPERWIAKAIAWMTAYLNGLPITAPKGSPSCEVAYRRAR